MAILSLVFVLFDFVHSHVMHVALPVYALNYCTYTNSNCEFDTDGVLLLLSL